MSGQSIRIGYCLSLTGPLASNGKTARLAHQIWEKDVNQKGGLLGRNVGIVGDQPAFPALQSLRDAGGDATFFAEGLAWLARKIKPLSDAPPADRERTPFEHVAEETKQALRDNGGEPYTGDGESFWRRSIRILTEARDRAAAWVKEVAQGFVGRITSDRDSKRDDPGFER